MNLFRLGVRFWITLTSLASFLIGWVMLAQLPEPHSSSSTQNNSNVTQLPTLAPLPDLNSNTTTFPSQPQISVQPNFQSQQTFRPRFRTGGS